MRNFIIAKILVTSICVLILVPVKTNAQTDNVLKKITVQQCDSLINANETNPNFVILDVRSQGSWKPDHLEGSINCNYYDADFDTQLAALPRNKMYLVHCQSGARSAGAVQIMKNLEFSEVYEMSGGINAWKNALYPTTSEITPKLMLVAYNEFSLGNTTDTLQITITNRGNDSLIFSSIVFSDVHDITTNFNSDVKLAGAQDYAFSLYHSPGYFDTDSTGIIMESNGGELDIHISFKNGLIQNVDENPLMIPLIYPNPAKNIISLKNSGILKNIEISIFNLNGQLLSKIVPFDWSTSMNISDVPNGIYLVRIKGEQHTFTQKLIKHD